MIRPPGFAGVIFGNAASGDPRTDTAAHRTFANEFGSKALAWANQVHGSDVAEPSGPGMAGDADVLLTGDPSVAVLVATADCVPVLIEGEHSTAMIHAGWRGMAKGVVAKAVTAMREAGDRPIRGAIGPSIGPCCYEVGPEVVDALAPHHATTTWGTTSVDLWAAAESQLDAIEVWQAGVCTFSDRAYWSHRRDGTRRRQVSIAWLPDV